MSCKKYSLLEDFSLTKDILSEVLSHKWYTFSAILTHKGYALSEICSKGYTRDIKSQKGQPKYFSPTKVMVFQNFSHKGSDSEHRCRTYLPHLDQPDQSTYNDSCSQSEKKENKREAISDLFIPYCIPIYKN